MPAFRVYAYKIDYVNQPAGLNVEKSILSTPPLWNFNPARWLLNGRYKSLELGSNRQ